MWARLPGCGVGGPGLSGNVTPWDSFSFPRHIYHCSLHTRPVPPRTSTSRIFSLGQQGIQGMLTKYPAWQVSQSQRPLQNCMTWLGSLRLLVISFDLWKPKHEVLDIRAAWATQREIWRESFINNLGPPLKNYGAPKAKFGHLLQCLHRPIQEGMDGLEGAFNFLLQCLTWPYGSEIKQASLVKISGVIYN